MTPFFPPRPPSDLNYDLLQVADPEHYKPVDKAAESDPGPVLIRLVGKDAKPIAAVIVGKTKSYPVEGKPGQYLVRKPDEARAWVRSEEHTSELQSLMRISYAVFCLTKKPNK